jgi:Cu/Ag efflux pump CusA
VPGAFLALFVTQKALSMPSMIGLIMLMGIATKNSILLIDYVCWPAASMGWIAGRRCSMPAASGHGRS